MLLRTACLYIFLLVYYRRFAATRLVLGVVVGDALLCKAKTQTTVEGFQMCPYFLLQYFFSVFFLIAIIEKMYIFTLQLIAELIGVSIELTNLEN